MTFAHTFKIKFAKPGPSTFGHYSTLKERNFTCLDAHQDPSRAKLYVETFVFPSWEKNYGTKVDSIEHWTTQVVEADLRGVQL